MPRLTIDEWGLQLALLTGRRSTCLRRAVGAVLLNAKGHVLATGYNGRAAGLPHCNDPASQTGRVFFGQAAAVPGPASYPNACAGALSPSGTNLDGCEAIHAEQNALLQCRDVSLIHTCCVTCSPCMTCVKLLLNTGCKRIIFRDEYPHLSAANLWLSMPNKEWVKIDYVTTR